MREIKFRAWQVPDKKMWFPDLGNLPTVGGNTLMQYTGLKDKNGVEIYEGDIVTTDYPTVKNMADAWLVEYGHTGMFQMAVGSFKQSIHELVYNDWKLEVIGNIYENGDLLK